MRCVWCDSEYTFSGGASISLNAVMERVRELGCKLVEVTGGEPLAQKEALPLIEQLCSEGFEVLVETGGFFPIDEVDSRAKIILDVKCPDSGEESRNHWPNLKRLRLEKDEVKFVIASLNDWNYALAVIKEHDLINRASILISPAWDAIDLQQLADAVSASGLDIRMQLQIHKYIWGPEVHGV